jgi:hypothetical protein
MIKGAISKTPKILVLAVLTFGQKCGSDSADSYIRKEK